MMQQTLFDSAPEWPRGWSEGVLIDEKSSNILGCRRRLVEYTHDSGVKLTTSQKWRLETDEFLYTSFRVWLTEEEWQPRAWVKQWSHLANVRLGRSEDWDWLLTRTEPDEVTKECPGPYGQWVFVRKLVEALRAREVM